jgi:hypothetical protein
MWGFKSKAKQSEDWLKDASIYQLFVGRSPQANFTSHVGVVFRKLAELNWKRFIKSHALDVIYLLGVFDNAGPIKVTEEEGENLAIEDPLRLPSPFALSDHTALNPKLGSQSDFRQLLKTINKAGGQVIVDFVGNHTGLNHPWINDHPEYYVSNSNSETGLLHEFSGDVVKLDYNNPQLCEAQLAVLQCIRQLGVDGLRCDMAHLVPIEFWRRAIASIKKVKPDFVFVAEAYSDSVFSWDTLEGLMDAGFDAVYHEFLYKNLRQVFIEQQPLDFLVGHINFILNYEHRNKLVHYLANHDDPLFPEVARVQQALMTLLLFMPGTSFVYNGQLNGLARRLKHHVLDVLPEEMFEFTKVPKWFDLASKLRSKQRPLITAVEHIGNGVLECPVTIADRQGKLVANFGTDTTTPNVTVKGSILGLEPGVALPAGQAEVYA